MPDPIIADLIIVPFRGPGSDVGQLTWSQMSIWQSMQAAGRSIAIGGMMAMPAGTTVDELAAVLRFAMCRHPSLRTRLRFEPDGRPLQVVSESGEIALSVVDVPDDGDPAETAAAICARQELATFDYVNEWPVWMSVVGHRRHVTHLVAMGRASMAAGKYSYYDPAALRELIASVSRERVERVDTACFFNDRRAKSRDGFEQEPSRQAILDALPHTVRRRGRRFDWYDGLFFLHINESQGAISYAAWSDTHHLAPADLETFVRQFEAAAIEAALDPDAPALRPEAVSEAAAPA